MIPINLLKTLFSAKSCPCLFFMLLWNSAIMAVWKIRIFTLQTNFGCFFLTKSTTAPTMASATADGLTPPWPGEGVRTNQTMKMRMKTETSLLNNVQRRKRQAWCSKTCTVWMYLFKLFIALYPHLNSCTRFRK